MSNTARIAATAANTLTKPLNVEEVFSTFVADATGSGSLTINNGIDLSGEGGIVWVKSRNNAHNHYIFDPNVGSGGYLIPNSTTVGLTGANYTFTSTGLTDAYNNYSGNEAVWWTFRKAPKFFDVVTYTGDGVAGRTISHNLGSVPACIIVKQTSSVSNWPVYHRSLGSSAYIELNSTNAKTSNVTRWYGTDPTSTDFTVNVTNVNKLNETYVAYLFAHNDGDGDFGPTGDQDIIKCGNYVQGTSSYDVDLGFEPQWVLIKSATSATNWMLFDNMRGLVVDGNDAILKANTSAAEENTDPYLSLSPNGFTSHLDQITGNQTYIYIAIRRGPMAVPESATDVFDVNTYSNNGNSNIYNTGFNTDMNINKNATSSDGFYVIDRLRGAPFLLTNLTVAETGGTSTFWNTGNNLLDLESSWWSTTSGVVSWSWKRAPNYFDVVAYTGNGVAGRTVSHNLGVAPEMMWVKRRNTTGEWAVYHSGVDASAPQDYYTLLGATNAKAASTAIWNDTAPTADVFSLGTIGWVNASSDNYIAYLFASLDGVSKVGSFTHTNGTATNVDCGFTSGARFVLLKYYDQISDWWLFDTERGIAVGNDARLILNQPYAETSTDQIDPYSAGFTYDAARASGDIIFYAIA